MAVSTVKRSHLFLQKTFTARYDIAASGVTRITKTDLNFVNPPGYSFAGIAGFSTGATSLSVVFIRPDSEEMLGIRNDTTTAATSRLATLIALFVSETVQTA